VKLNAGGGCVTPTVASVQNATYRPLARPLFIYAKRAAFRGAEVAAFVGYVFNNAGAIARQADMVPLTQRQLAKARYQYRQALKQTFTRG